MKSTPSFIITLFIVFICTIFANSGIKTFARLVEILVVLFTINYFLGFFLSYFKLFKIDYVLPIFDASGLQFAKGTMITAGTVAESLLFLMIILGSVPQVQKKNLAVIKGLAIWSVILSFAILIMEGDIGHEMLSRVAEAGVTVSRVIQIENYIRGMEILLLMTYQYITIAKQPCIFIAAIHPLKSYFMQKRANCFSFYRQCSCLLHPL